MLLLAAFWGAAVALADVNAALLCVSVLACAAVFLNFRVGVVLLILVIPISASALFPHEMLGITGLNPVNLLLVATLASWAFHSLARRRGLFYLVPTPLLFLYVVPFVLAGFVGSQHVGDIPIRFFEYLPFTDAAGFMRDQVAKPLLTVVFGLLVGAAVFWAQKPERFITPLLVSAWLMALLAIGYFVAADMDIRQLSGVTSRAFFSPLGIHANDLGRLYATAYALFLFIWARTDNPQLGVPLLATMAIVVAALLLTFSRGAFLSFILVNLLFLVSRRDEKAVFIGGCLAIGVLLVGGIVLSRMSTGVGADANVVTAGRIDGIWLPLLPEIWRSPLIGSGVSSIMWSEAMRAEAMFRVTHAHNAYLGAILDMGLIGLVLVCAFWFHVWRNFRSLSRDEGLNPTLRGFFEGASVGLVAFLVVGMAGSSLTPVPEQCFLWFAVGVMYGLLWKRREEQRAARRVQKTVPAWRT